MTIYVDASEVNRRKTAIECCRALRGATVMAKELHARALCRRLQWVMTDNTYVTYELIKAIDDTCRESGSVTAREKRDLQALSNELATGFLPSRIDCAYSEASRTASLVWCLLRNVVDTIPDEELPQHVEMSSGEHLSDDNVCRVLYCNHPDVSENAKKKGYVSRAHGNKHFLASRNDPTWVTATSVVAQQYQEKVSKFCPGMAFGSSQYEKLECDVLMDAMKNGKYSLEKMNGHVYEHRDVVGASDGEMTHKVCIAATNHDVHLYPVPDTTPTS